MKMRQVEFHKPGSHQYGSWVTKKVAWVNAYYKLKPGVQVTFEGEEGRWTVAHVYDTIIEYAELDKKWGLNLPKSQRTER